MNLRPRARMGAAVISCAALAAGGLALAGSAHATTSTCTNIATPVSAPIGCGGIYLPEMGSGTQPNGTSLALTAASNAFNGAVVVDPYDATNSLQDWTVFQYCQWVSGPRSAADPCGTGGHPVKNPVNGQAEYVAMLTPDGTSDNWPPSSVAVGDASSDLCLSVEQVTRTIRNKHVKRWVTVLRNCSIDSAFIPGTPDSPADAGTPGIVVGAVNPWQVWSAVAEGSNGYALAEDFLSDNFRNTPYVLDDSGYGGPGTQQIAYPAKDTTDNQTNQVWKVVGCTNPVVSLTPGFWSCPLPLASRPLVRSRLCWPRPGLSRPGPSSLNPVFDPSPLDCGRT